MHARASADISNQRKAVAIEAESVCSSKLVRDFDAKHRYTIVGDP